MALMATSLGILRGILAAVGPEHNSVEFERDHLVTMRTAMALPGKYYGPQRVQWLGLSDMTDQRRDQ